MRKHHSLKFNGVITLRKGVGS